MKSPDNSFLPDSEPDFDQEQQRLQTLEDLGLLATETVPVFEEATQTAAHFVNAPICILGLLERDRLWFKSAVGLSRISLMNDLASSRQLSRRDSFCAHVVSSQQVQIIADAAAEPTFANSLLVQRYGIRSYLGVPLLSSNGQCLGTLAVMALTPRQFTDKEADILQLIARWSISEFERNRLLTISAAKRLPLAVAETDSSVGSKTFVSSTKSRLVAQISQELCTPLTSIVGMARVLGQEIYGTLSAKQREYVDIIHNSGQHLSSLIDEVMALEALDEDNLALDLRPIDIEMLCQQTVNPLKQAAQRYNQHIQLTVEPGPRICLLDKHKMRQLLYHLVFSVMQSTDSGSTIHIHVSRRQHFVSLAVWSSHPWLGDGFSQPDFSDEVLHQFTIAIHNQSAHSARSSNCLDESKAQRASTAPEIELDEIASFNERNLRQGLGLLLSHQLVELHGGDVTVQGSLDEGYRYVIKLPQPEEVQARL
jgi:signal transduction histidine kinase